MLASLRWLLPTALPVVLFVVLALRTDPRREPRWLVATTFVLGALLAVGTLLATRRVVGLTGLELHASAAGAGGALVLLFFVIAPVQEAGKVAAAWPALLFKLVDEPYDGVVYAAASSLGFAAVEGGMILREHPTGGIWVARTLLALPSHVFFACIWGYALGRAKQSKLRLSVFPLAFATAIAARGLYAYLVYDRGPGALVGVTPLLAAMGVVAWIMGRDLRERHERLVGAGPPSSRASRLSLVAQPPSLATVRAALSRADRPMSIRWILYGALVTLGAMWAGLAAGVGAARLLHIDLSTVDENDVGAAAPALLLLVCLLASFPTSGWLVARAARAQTLLEPALAAGLALAITVVALGLAAPFAVAFGLALAPIAWVLSCAGAWVARRA